MKTCHAYIQRKQTWYLHVFFFYRSICMYWKLQIPIDLAKKKQNATTTLNHPVHVYNYDLQNKLTETELRRANILAFQELKTFRICGVKITNL